MIATHVALSRETSIGLGVSAFAVAAMAVDHLMGDDPGLEDPVTFLLSSGVALALAGAVFGLVVPRAKADPATAATHGAVLSGLSVVLMIGLWLGLPFAFAGGGIALGLIGRRGDHRRRATVTVVIGVLMRLLGLVDYAEQAIRKTW